jgi:hypothetical protein
MANNTKRSTDRWSSSEKTTFNVTQRRTPLIELSTKSSTDDELQNNEYVRKKKNSTNH